MADLETPPIEDICNNGYAETNGRNKVARGLIEDGNCRNKTNNLILNLTPENVTQHSRIE